MPIRGSKVVLDPSFHSDLEGLRGSYPKVDDAVNNLTQTLELGYHLPETNIDIGSQVYMVLLDYPPKGADGFQQFRVVYHATDPEPSWTRPYRTFTLLTITDRNPLPT